MANETAAVKSLPARSEIPVEDTWRLEDIFANDQEWESEFQEVKNQISGIKEFEGKLGESAETLYKALQFQDKLLRTNWKAYIHIHICAMTKTRLILFIKA